MAATKKNRKEFSKNGFQKFTAKSLVAKMQRNHHELKNYEVGHHTESIISG
jgi:hypothetical protein